LWHWWKRNLKPIALARAIQFLYWLRCMWYVKWSFSGAVLWKENKLKWELITEHSNTFVRAWRWETFATWSQSFVQSLIILSFFYYLLSYQFNLKLILNSIGRFNTGKEHKYTQMNCVTLTVLVEKFWLETSVFHEK